MQFRAYEWLINCRVESQRMYKMKNYYKTYIGDLKSPISTVSKNICHWTGVGPQDRIKWFGLKQPEKGDWASSIFSTTPRLYNFLSIANSSSLSEWNVSHPPATCTLITVQTLHAFTHSYHWQIHYDSLLMSSALFEMIKFLFNYQQMAGSRWCWSSLGTLSQKPPSIW